MNIDELKLKISGLPKGSITYKTIHGNKYPYWQYTENGKRRTVYVRKNQLEMLESQISERKELEKQLKRLFPVNKLEMSHIYECAVVYGDSLDVLTYSVRTWKKRDCYKRLEQFLYSVPEDRVCVLYGLRRTGKTTLMKQAIAGMDKAMYNKTIYIKLSKNDTLSKLNKDLQHLNSLGYKYIFIDEVTLAEDFIDGAALLSDIYAAMGMKIVLSGTDSLGFRLAAKDELYDRIRPMICTTHIPFKEFSRVLGIDDVDEYIRYGGTLRIGNGGPEDEDTSFIDDEQARVYVDTAVSRNIQHSLERFRDGSQFRSLMELYDNDELTNVINRVVEDANHKFVKKVITSKFKSHDLGATKRNLMKERDINKRSDILENIDINCITNKLAKILEIREVTEQQVKIRDEHLQEIQDYLTALNLIDYTERRHYGKAHIDKSVVFTQPGLRYSQANALVYLLMQDEMFNGYSQHEKHYVVSRLMSEIKGRMLEDIVLYETQKSLNSKQYGVFNQYDVFKLDFEIDGMFGEFDMVVCDTINNTCKLFEVKHSNQLVPEQAKHLNNVNVLQAIEHQYGVIVDKVVLYKGKNTSLEDVKYVNVEEYLKSLSI